MGGDDRPIGLTQFRHGPDGRGKAITDHQPDPVPVTELTDWITACDFCGVEGRVGAVPYVYVCGDIVTDTKQVTAVYVGHGDYAKRNMAARALRTDVKTGDAHQWGENWAACEPCARLIDARDLNGLVFRVFEHGARRYNWRRRIVAVRAELTDTYRTALDTLLPVRGVVSPGCPQGVWHEHPADAGPVTPAQ